MPVRLVVRSASDRANRSKKLTAEIDACIARMNKRGASDADMELLNSLMAERTAVESAPIGRVVAYSV